MIHQTEIKFLKEEKPWADSSIIWLVKRELEKTYNGYLKEGKVEWQEVQEAQLISGEGLFPFMIIPRFFPIQEFIDALTNKAVLPSTEQSSTKAELSATQRHLEDMRRLVFEKDITIQNAHYFEPKIPTMEGSPKKAEGGGSGEM